MPSPPPWKKHNLLPAFPIPRPEELALPTATVLQRQLSAHSPFPVSLQFSQPQNLALTSYFFLRAIHRLPKDHLLQEASLHLMLGEGSRYKLLFGEHSGQL